MTLARLTCITSLLAALGALPCQAQPRGGAAAPPAASVTLSSGEVLKLDPGKAKITLRHTAIEHLGLPAMSMSFHVRDAALLDGLRVGDKVRFSADRIEGQFTVTRIER